MTFTFSAALDTEVSRVRQMIGDTVDVAHDIEDETIEAYLTGRSEAATALQLCYDLMARFARSVDSDVDGQSERNSQKFKAFQTLAAQLERRVAAEAPAAEAGADANFAGISVFGSTAQEVVDARDDEDLAMNAPLRWL